MEEIEKDFIDSYVHCVGAHPLCGQRC